MTLPRGRLLAHHRGRHPSKSLWLLLSLLAVALVAPVAVHGKVEAVNGSPRGGCNTNGENFCSPAESDIRTSLRMKTQLHVLGKGGKYAVNGVALDGSSWAQGRCCDAEGPGILTQMRRLLELLCNECCLENHADKSLVGLLDPQPLFPGCWNDVSAIPTGENRTITFTGPNAEMDIIEWFLESHLEEDATLPNSIVINRLATADIFTARNFDTASANMITVKRLWQRLPTVLDALCCGSTTAIHVEGLEKLRSLRKRERVSQQRVEDIFTVPAKLAFVGKTGAGKSTLINAIVGAKSMPTSSDICTATSLSLEYAESINRESTFVQYKESGECDKILSSMSSQLQQYKTSCERRMQEELDVLGEMFAGVPNPCKKVGQQQDLFHAAQKVVNQIPNTTARTKELIGEFSSAYESFACSKGDKNVEPLFVKHIVLKRHIEMLRNVTLIDTPGLLDHDEARSKVTKDMIKANDTDGWVYAMPTADKPDTSNKDLIRELQNQGGNVKHNMLVLSRANEFTVFDKFTARHSFQAALEERRKAFNEYAREPNEPIPAVNAYAVERLSEFRSSFDYETGKYLFGTPGKKNRYRDGALANQHWGLPWLEMQVPPFVGSDNVLADALKELLEEIGRSITGRKESLDIDENRLDLLSNILLDVSGVLQVTDGIRLGVQQRQEQRVISEINNAYAALNARMETWDNALRNCDKSKDDTIYWQSQVESLQYYHDTVVELSHDWTKALAAIREDIEAALDEKLRGVVQERLRDFRGEAERKAIRGSKLDGVLGIRELENSQVHPADHRHFKYNFDDCWCGLVVTWCGKCHVTYFGLKHLYVTPAVRLAVDLIDAVYSTAAKEAATKHTSDIMRQFDAFSAKIVREHASIGDNLNVSLEGMRQRLTEPWSPVLTTSDLYNRMTLISYGADNDTRGTTIVSATDAQWNWESTNKFLFSALGHKLEDRISSQQTILEDVLPEFARKHVADHLIQTSKDLMDDITACADDIKRKLNDAKEHRKGHLTTEQIELFQQQLQNDIQLLKEFEQVVEADDEKYLPFATKLKAITNTGLCNFAEVAEAMSEAEAEAEADAEVAEVEAEAEAKAKAEAEAEVAKVAAAKKVAATAAAARKEEVEREATSKEEAARVAEAEEEAEVAKVAAAKKVAATAAAARKEEVEREATSKEE
eukprot:COSAG06_NODE_3385_length_5423_cov_22.051841_2_plen_1172_part_01